jgi:hypothetical protein
MSQTENIIDAYPKAKDFLTEEEQLNITDNHMLYSVIEKLLTRIEALER